MKLHKIVLLMLHLPKKDLYMYLVPDSSDDPVFYTPPMIN